MLITQGTDQVEYDAITHGSCVVDRGLYGDRISGVIDDLEVDNVYPNLQERWHQADIVADDAIGNMVEEIERRNSILKSAYPFKLKGGTLRYSPSHTRIYEFMLSISCSPNLVSGDFSDLPRTFERVATVLVTEYFGDYATGWHTGWPRDGGASFQQVVGEIHRSTGEWQWNPQTDLDPNTVRDEGCDFVIWLAPSDSRKIGSLFVLGQCACGNNWQSKYKDLKLETLQRWFHPLSLLNPVRSFAIPHYVPETALREVTRSAGLLFDRARLTSIAHKAKKELLDKGTLELMNNATKLVRASLQLTKGR